MIQLENSNNSREELILLLESSNYTIDYLENRIVDADALILHWQQTADDNLVDLSAGTDAELDGADLSNAYLAFIDLRRADLTNANLSNAN